MGRLSKVSTLYKASTERDYFEDYLNLHIALGLGMRYRTTGIVVPIDAQKEHEFIIFISITSLGSITVVLFLIFIKFTDAT